MPLTATVCATQCGVTKMSGLSVFTDRTDLTEEQLVQLRNWVDFFKSKINPDGTEPIRLSAVVDHPDINWGVLARLPPSPQCATIAASPSYFRNVDPDSLEPDLILSKPNDKPTIVFHVNTKRSGSSSFKVDKTYTPNFPRIMTPVAAAGPYEPRLRPPGNFMAENDPRRATKPEPAWLKVMSKSIYTSTVNAMFDVSPIVPTDSHNFDMISFLAWKHIVYMKAFEFMSANISWFPGFYAALTSRHEDLAMAARITGPAAFPATHIAAENARLNAHYKQSINGTTPRPRGPTETYNTWEFMRIAMRNVPYPGFNIKNGMSINLEEYLFNVFGRITKADQDRLKSDPLFTSNPEVRRAVLEETAPSTQELAKPFEQRTERAVPYKGIPIFTPEMERINPDNADVPVGSKMVATVMPSFRLWKSPVGYGFNMGLTPVSLVYLERGAGRPGREDPASAYPSDAFAGYSKRERPAIAAPPMSSADQVEMASEEDPEMAAAMIAAMAYVEEDNLAKRARHSN